MENSEQKPLINNDVTLRKPKIASTGRKAAVLVSAIAIQTIVNGLIFSLSIFYAELIQVFESKRANAALVTSLFSGICTGGGFLWTPVIKRFGLGPSSIMGATIGAAAFAVNFVATDLSMIIVMVGVIAGNVEAWFMVDIIVSRGFPRERGSLITSLIGLSMFFGRIIGITMRSKCRIPPVYHWMYVPTAVGVCHAIIINLYDYWTIVGMCIVCGTLFGVMTSLTPTIMYEASGLERYPQGMALVNLMYGTGNFFSGLLGGFIRDTYGDYVPMFYLALATSLYISITTIPAMCIMKRRRRKYGQESSVEYGVLKE